ncbi:hypothetical protein ACIRU8_11765 [Streptomyces sp. NPDC101175]|uniref:hypothetical protein n=1 Tax=Streptomyces sp. NPDC101175 TaxID=3366123 RepID=UPI003833D56D
MKRARRELLGPGGLVLQVRDRHGPPPLRFETAAGGRLLLRQGGRPLLLGREEQGGCARESLFVHRLDGFRSPLPRIRSELMRNPGNWVHQYARWLEEAQEGPLHDARWNLREWHDFPAYVWWGDFMREWPACRLDWCAGGWEGVVPLRPLSATDAPRVKAYRGHAREDTLAPVLLWRVTPLDGWVILDGHDRAVAALAEGRTPPCLVLRRVPDDETWRRTADEVTEAHEHRMEHLTRDHADTGTGTDTATDTQTEAETDRRRAALERAYADTLSTLPYDGAPTPTWPLPGGAPAWDDLAARAMFECPRD